MNLSLKSLTPVTLALAAALALTACGKKEDKPAVEVIKIGFAAPLTGPQAHIGLDIKNGTQLGIDDVNAAGLEVGGKKIKLELVVEDDEANPTKATTVAQKLADAKVVAVVGHFNSGSSIPASKIYADNGIPQISPGSTAPKYTQNGYATTFRVVANDDQQGPVAGEFAVKQLGAKNIAVIDDSTAYGQGLANSFADKVKALGANLVASEHTTDQDTDFTAILTNIKSKNPDIIFFGGIDPQAGPMAKQLASLGIKAKLMGGDGIQTPNFIKLAGEAAEGTMASIPGLPKDQMPGGKAFLAKFKAKYNADVELFAPMGYDAVFVIADAMKRAGSTNPGLILPEIRKTNYAGVIGPIAFDKKGDLKDGPITVYVVKGGKWEPLKVVGGSASTQGSSQAVADQLNAASPPALDKVGTIIKSSPEGVKAVEEIVKPGGQK